MENAYKEKCIECLKNSKVSDLEPINVIEIDSSANLYDAFQVWPDCVIN
jgi:hypothetical protein